MLFRLFAPSYDEDTHDQLLWRERGGRSEGNTYYVMGRHLWITEYTQKFVLGQEVFPR